MKKIILSLLFVILCISTMQAQKLLADFENETTDELILNTSSYTSTRFTETPAIYNNPDRTGINASEKCFGAVNVANADWTGNRVQLKLKEPVEIKTGNRLLSFLVYRSIQPKEFRIGFNDYEETSQVYFSKLPTDARWERVIVDLGEKYLGKTLESIWIIFSCNWYSPRTGWGEAEYFFDDFTLQSTLQLVSAQIAINPSIIHQAIDDFGASDCWTADILGKYWSQTQNDLAAERLFSKEFDENGNPKGIGLSNWRVNIGAGSAEQGNESGISDITRRGECFLLENGAYDWTKQSGQQYFMRKAKEYGCENFLLFSNSPPVFFTKNGKAYANSGESGCNLESDKFDDFAEFLATVAEHFINEGYNVKYISPVNEPQYDWTGGQEGSPWQNRNIKNIVSELDKSIQNKNLPTKIMIPEGGQWDKVIGGSGRATNQVEAFFNPNNTSTYIGNLTSVAPLIAGHSYWTFGTNSLLKNTRISVKESAEKYGLKVYQTEWSMLDAAPSTETGFPASYDAASYMDIALFMGKLIYCDLAFANASSWSYWTTFATEVYSQKNRFYLMRLRPSSGDYGSLLTGGTIEQNQNLWVLGNYSRFIRPGYKRIQLDGAAEMNHLLGTAYISPDGSQLVSVYVNTNSRARNIDVKFQELNGQVAKVRKYVTRSISNLSRDQTLPEDYTGESIAIPARSVVTIVYDIDKSDSSLENVLADGKEVFIYPNPARKNENLFISIPGKVNQFDPIHVSLYSLNGEIKYDYSIVTDENLINISLPSYIGSGIYIMKIRCLNKEYHQKLMIK